MKASKLVLTIFFGFIFTVIAYLCFYMLSTNHNRSTKDEVHYVPFEAPFKHVVVEDGWNLDGFIGDGLNLANEMWWLGADIEKLNALRDKMTPFGIRLSKYYPDYDDENLLSRIEIKNDTLFFRRIKAATSFKRVIRMNLLDLSSLGVSGNSSVDISSKRNDSGVTPVINLGHFVINISEGAKVSVSSAEISQLTLKADGFSSFTFGNFSSRGSTDTIKVIQSDISLFGNAVMKVIDDKVALTNYKIYDESILVFYNESVETVYGKKDSKYVIDFNKRTNASSSSSN